MSAVRDHALGKEPLSRPLARVRLADSARASAHAGDDRGADRSLKIEHCVVVRGAKFASQIEDCFSGIGTQRMALPLSAWSEMETVNYGHRGVADGNCGIANRHCGNACSLVPCRGPQRAAFARWGGLVPRSLFSGPYTQQRSPARLDDPANLPVRMSQTQRRHRRQRVKNIAHCTQADDEQAEVGLRVQRSIFAQRRWRTGRCGGRADAARNREDYAPALSGLILQRV